MLHIAENIINFAHWSFFQLCIYVEEILKFTVFFYIITGRSSHLTAWLTWPDWQSSVMRPPSPHSPASVEAVQSRQRSRSPGGGGSHSLNTAWPPTPTDTFCQPLYVSSLAIAFWQYGHYLPQLAIMWSY